MRLGAAITMLALAAVLAAVTPAAAHWRAGVFIGAYPYPYPWPYYPYYYAYYPYVPYGYYYDYPTPPPGWVPGHWELRDDGSGHKVRVWVPTHLQ
jgi:hypothetical protein